jgi:hypothetical protein
MPMEVSGIDVNGLAPLLQVFDMRGYGLCFQWKA